MLIAIGYLDLKYLPNTMNILSQRARRFCTGVSSTGSTTAYK